MKRLITLLLVGGVLLTAAGIQAEESKKVFGDLDGQIMATGMKRVVKLDSDGNELWSYPGQNVHDVWLLPNGNVLFADNNAQEINPETNEIVWSYIPKVEEGGGTFGVQRLDNGLTMVAENSTGRILEVDQDGKIVFELQLPLIEVGSHQNFRHCRKLKNNNYLVTHKGIKLVREYTPKGEVVQEIEIPNAAFSAVRLPNGNTVVGHIDGVTEYDKQGKACWTFSVEELPEGISTGLICGLHCLDNGNIVCGLYSIPLADEPFAGLFEITREKKLVWRYQNAKGDKNMMGVHKLTAEGKPMATPLR